MSNNTNIWNFDEGDIFGFSLNEIIVLIDELENWVTSQYFLSLDNQDMIIDLIETTDDVYTKATLIRNKIVEDRFSEPLPRNWKTKKEDLLSKLMYIFVTIQHYRDSYRMWALTADTGLQITEIKRNHKILVDDYNKKKQDLETQIDLFKSTTNESLKKQTETIDKKINETIEEIQGAEGKIVSHVLSLMGIFTAVIAIILSVVATSSTWLNNASGASAILAFVVPNMVTLVAVISIVLLVFMYQKTFYPPALPEGEKEKKAPTIISAILLVIILFITIFMGVLAYRATRAEPHLRHVISESEYVVKEKQDSNTDEVYKYIEFIFEGQSYEFAYDETYFHDSNLYYCPVHDTLE